MLLTPEVFHFYLWGGIILVGGLGVVFSRRVIYSAFSLILSLFGVSALYVLLTAPFLAAVQVLLYIGGIAVLILFAVIVAQQKGGGILYNTQPHSPWALLVVLVLMISMGRILTSIQWPVASVEGRTMYNLQISQIIPQARGEEMLTPQTNTYVIGLSLSRTYVMIFELMSVILLVAMIGAIIYVRKEEGESGSD